MGFQFYHIGVLENLPVKNEVEADGMTIRQFLDYLGDKYKIDLAKEILEEGGKGIKPGFVLILNGKSIYDLNGLDTIIPAGSQLLLSIEIFGG